MQGHFMRCLGALIGFAVMAQFKPLNMIENFKRWPLRTRWLLLLAGFGGTYLSLLMYLSAVKIGHLASLAAITITGPMFATVIECMVRRQRPSPYLFVAFSFFCIGFWILVIA
jgi:drug/metabolite transporter (DMT)-like permease